MIAIIVILSILLIFVSIALFFTTKAAIRQVTINQAWERFYSSTLDDIEECIKYLEQLMGNETISLDPDVQRVKKLIRIVYRILAGYIDEINKYQKEKKEAEE